MQPNNRALIFLLLILLVWITGSQEMHLNKERLTDTVFVRYIIYFSWLLLTASIGYVAWRHQPYLWIKQVWITTYALVVVLLLLLGIIDLLIVPFTMAQKKYIQTFRLFFQSPVPFVIIYLVAKQVPTKKISL
jgi:hypothetical protein